MYEGAGQRYSRADGGAMSTRRRGTKVERVVEDGMNKDVFAGWWKQARGQAKSWWGQLTDDELDQIEGEADKLVGYLQTRYGWTREQAEEEIERRMDRAA